MSTDAQPSSPFRRSFVRAGIVLAAGAVATVALFQFVLGPLVYEQTLDGIADRDRVHDQLVATYDIETIDFETETVHTGPGLRYGKPTANDSYEVEYAVIDGVRRDCEIVDEDTDPSLACTGWEPPLR